MWWQRTARLELAVVRVAEWALLRATKHYRMTAMGAEGELYTRDLGHFDEYLRTVFDEVHVWVSTFRDVTVSLARRRMQEKGFRCLRGASTTDPEQLAEHYEGLRDEFTAAQNNALRYDRFRRLDRGRSSLLGHYLSIQIPDARQRMTKARAEAKVVHDQLTAQKRLEEQYLRKAEATCLLFGCCSNIQAARGPDEFLDALRSVVKELQDAHRYQIQQKLQGGKLQIFVEEMTAPGIALLTRWAGGALSPRQLARLGPEFQPLREAVEQQFMVFPWEDIVLAGAVQDEKKRVGSHMVRHFLRRLERVPTAPGREGQSPKSSMPAWIGKTSGGPRQRTHPWGLPLDKMIHVLVSGAPGSGKSYLGRVIVESSTVYPNLGIVVLDPRNQWVGLLCSEDRPEIVAAYKAFGVEPTQARSFDFVYHAVGMNLGEPLPEDLRQLAKGRWVVSFKGLKNRARCELFARVLDALFEACSGSESEKPRILVVVEEAHLFTKRRVSSDARPAAERAELSMERAVREGRKYGVSLVILTQSVRDFSYGSAAIRQNVATQIFMHNKDREIEYAADFLGNGQAIVRLRPGEAFLCNPTWGVAKVAVRPPFSKVWEPSASETERLVGGSSFSRSPLSNLARRVLEAVGEHYARTGAPAKVSRLFAQLGVTGKQPVA